MEGIEVISSAAGSKSLSSCFIAEALREVGGGKMGGGPGGGDGGDCSLSIRRVWRTNSGTFHASSAIDVLHRVLLFVSLAVIHSVIP